MPDYAALARQFGAVSSEPSGGSPDYAALAQQFGGESESRRPVSAEDFTDEDTPQGSALGRFFSNAGEMLNPVTMATSAAQAVLHPVDTAKALIGAQVGQFRTAKDMYEQARYQEAAAHGLAGALPLLGPAAAAAGEQIGRGDVAGGLGKAAGLLAPAAIGAAIPESVGARGLTVNPETADAVAFAQKNDIPLSVANATDNKFAQALQHVTDRSLTGSFVADKAAKAQQARLATIGEQLAAKAHPSPVAAAQAGEAAQAGVGNVVTGQRLLANDAYDRLRQVEAQTPMAVDLTPVQKVLQPIAERLAAKKDVVGSLMGSEATAAAKIDAIMKSPESVPLSVADSALSDLKAMARSNHPDLRSVGQGIAAKAVNELHGAVTDAASTNPDALAALNEGRIATKAKYAAADVLKKLEGPARNKSGATAFRGLTQSGDTAIGHLRDTLTQAPDTKPLIGRAVLDGLIDHPTAGAAKTFADWQKMGAETKAALYTPEHVRELDQFFALRKRLAANSNPSGTAHTLLTASQVGHLVVNPATGVATQIGAGVLAKLLHSPATVRLLNQGMRIPISNKAAVAPWLADLAAATSPSESQPSTMPARAR